MLNQKTEIDNEFEVVHQGVCVAINDNTLPNVSFEFPSLKDIQSINSSLSPKLAVHEALSQDALGLLDLYEERLAYLQDHEDSFNASSTYLNRLANYSKLLNREAEEERYLREAVNKHDNSNFTQAMLVNSLINQNKLDAAVGELRSQDVSENISTNIQLAYIKILKNDLESAEEYINKALSIDCAHYSARMMHGAIQLVKGNFQRAIRSFRVALAERADSPGLYINMAAAYVGMGNYNKALGFLKKALAVNPYNENALSFLADLTLLMKQPEIAVSYLERYLSYDQMSHSIWDRLARAYLVVEDYQGALKALKHQASIIGDVAVWNNIGVTYWRMKNHRNAMRYFNYALTKKSDDLYLNIVLASNISGVCIDIDDFSTARQIIENALANSEVSTLHDKHVYSLKLRRVVALEALGRFEDAVHASVQAIEEGILDLEINIRLLLHVLHYHTSIAPDECKAKEYINRIIKAVDDDQTLSIAQVSRALNNVMFSALSFELIEIAEGVAPKLNRFYKVDPYVTATFGLLKIRTGRIKAGEESYRKAISMAHEQKTKDRMKQRMNLEIGRVSLEVGDMALAKTHLEKAIKEKNGYEYASTAAKLLLRRLT